MNELTEQVISARAEIYAVVLVAFWMITLFSNLILAGALKGKSKISGKFWGIWLLTLLVSGIIVTFLVLAPEQTLTMINWVKELFK